MTSSPIRFCDECGAGNMDAAVTCFVCGEMLAATPMLAATSFSSMQQTTAQQMMAPQVMAPPVTTAPIPAPARLFSVIPDGAMAPGFYLA